MNRHQNDKNIPPIVSVLPKIADISFIPNTDHLQSSGHNETAQQMDHDSLFHFSSFHFIWIAIVFIAIILLATVALSVFYRAPFSWKKNPVHGSWASAIDVNQNQKLREQSFPLCVFSSIRNWLNRKHRLLRARRNRPNSKRIPSRAMMYYNKGRSRPATNSCSIESNNSNNLSSKSSRSENDSAAIMINNQINRSLLGNFVSNPNYFSETQQLLKNSCNY